MKSKVEFPDPVCTYNRSPEALEAIADFRRQRTHVDSTGFRRIDARPSDILRLPLAKPYHHWWHMPLAQAGWALAHRKSSKINKASHQWKAGL
jgi:hypothetical protein